MIVTTFYQSAVKVTVVMVQLQHIAYSYAKWMNYFWSSCTQVNKSEYV